MAAVPARRRRSRASSASSASTQRGPRQPSTNTSIRSPSSTARSRQSMTARRPSFWYIVYDPVSADRPSNATCLRRMKSSVSASDASLEQLGRRDRLGRGVDALEPLAVVDHRLADPPQVVERDGAVLATAVAVGARAGRHREVAVGDRPALAQGLAHLDDRRVVLVLDLAPVAARRARGASGCASTASRPSAGRRASRPSRRTAACRRSASPSRRGGSR